MLSKSVVALALGIAVIALLAELERGSAGAHAAPWSSGDYDDDDDDDDSDEFDFLSSNLDVAASPDASACDGQQCAAADGAALSIPSVLTRGLVTKRPRVQDVLKEHARFATDVDTKAFSGETLGYVTPWHSRGYDFAKLFRRKFTYIAPVWLQIREDPVDRTPIVTGTHDIDPKWIESVRGSRDGDARGPAIVPRVVYERNKLASTDVPVIIDALLALSAAHAFDGVVFEIPVVEGTMDLLLQLARAFQDAHKLLLLVLNRSTKGGKLPITHEMFDELLPLVHRFSMNAYDLQTPGPNAPLPWLRTTLTALTPDERAKILMGLPFYGYDNADAVTGPSFISALATEDVKRIRWDATAHECVSEFVAKQSGDHHVVFYPCLQFLADRLALYDEFGVGVAVWELGQGLDYFYDLL